MESVGYKNFDLNLARAVVEQMVAAFGAVDPVSLSVSNTTRVPNDPGVYQLHHRNQLVYVGQAEVSLQDRLERHRRTLSGRSGIKVSEMSFRALVVNRNWSTLATEQALLSHFGAEAQWNNSGFGSNDPGRNRDNTAEKTDHFNLRFPINLGVAVDSLVTQQSHGHLVLARLKESAPFIIRFHESALDNLRNAECSLPAAATVEQVLRTIGSCLGPTWQVSALPGRVLIYPERDASYPNATVVWPVPKSDSQ